MSTKLQLSGVAVVPLWRAECGEGSVAPPTIRVQVQAVKMTDVIFDDCRGVLGGIATRLAALLGIWYLVAVSNMSTRQGQRTYQRPPST